MVIRLSLALIITTLGITRPAAAQSPAGPPHEDLSVKAQLEALHAVPPPKQQADLDTERLAAARRERAASVQERTDGLWQSWRVSICQGCGVDQPPSGERVTAAKPRDVAAVEQAAVRPVENPRPRGQGRTASLYDDLSTENIDRIRRGPAQ